jgi:2-polyprenyl-3-methyl-5-hydroxy-6-metoxy-1,4-benzoquinol methylase
MGTDSNEAMEANRRNWNERVPIHAASRFYDVDGFKAGRSTLQSIELEELGDVSGRSLLHLQCHFGLDTMSWARLGAQVTGVDISDNAIGLARMLSRELGIEARFVSSNIYDLAGNLDGVGQYDIVFTSYGVLCWLPDLRRWAGIIARYLKPGGAFHMVENHPFSTIFDNGEAATDLVVGYPYFHSEEPERFEAGYKYTDGDTPLKESAFEWSHTIGEVLNSLISAGLAIDYLHEFPFTEYQALPMMKQGDDGWWRLPEHVESVPLMFSLKATKPAR